MKEVTLLQSDLKPNLEALRYSYTTAQSLENRILSQASALVLQPPSWANLTSSCPALSPSSLSSTTSSSPLLSTSSSLLSSSLLSTENTQLDYSSLSGSILCSSQPLNALIQSTAPPAAGEAQSLSEEHADIKLEKDESCSTDGLHSYSEEINEFWDQEEQKQPDRELPGEMPVLDLRMTEDEEKRTLDLDEGFEEFDSGSNQDAELLTEKKYKLLNLVCCSLVNKATSPGQLHWDFGTTVWSKIRVLATDIILTDPEFLLKVAVYTRQELNIRVTANFLLALAAHLPESKPHLRRYFCAAVQLPSDWLEVARIYSTCFSRCLPSGLKKALADKFKQFSEFQLAKYNTRKHRGKHCKKKHTAKEATPEQWDNWARLVGAEPRNLRKYLKKLSQRAVINKQQTEFNMKKMIKRLHIKEPAETVMSILGKKYPADVRTFWNSGLSGVWQSERANQRMRLKQVETWETRLSQEGNSATTWEKLIDNNSLPFMAMLRNLRNMITHGISMKHHKKILKKLSTEWAVIKSRQFPFRFLSAYKVILELGNSVSGSVTVNSSSKDILRGILRRIPRSGRFRRLDWSKASRSSLRSTLRVPFVRGLYHSKLKALQKARQRNCTPELLQLYREALDRAVQISCRHNIPPLSGHTLIIFMDTFSSSELKNADFSLPPESSDTNTEKAKLSVSAKEAGLLLSMMIRCCSEHTQFLLGDQQVVQEVEIEWGGLLENVRSVSKLDLEFSNSTQKIPHNDFFSKLLENKTKVDNIIIVAEYTIEWWMTLAVQRFQKLSINKPLVVEILISYPNCVDAADDPKTATLYGFSEQILRFVSERGSSRLLDHVEQMDKLHKIPPPAGSTTKPERTTDVMPLPKVPKIRWRCVRVFISSTFRDMHGERDVLIRSVFPELRRRAAALCLHLQEVDLRWGVTEDESERAAEICLQEVCRSQVLLGILGQRYGVVPPRPSLPDLPHYSWLKSSPDALSITEMEIRQFQEMFPDSAQSRTFFYFRSPRVLSSVPEDWRSDFAAESEETAAKLDALRDWIKNNGFKVTENYPCEWGGVIDGKAYLRALEDFAKAVMDDLWSAIQKLFVEESDEADLTAEIKEQEVHRDAQRGQFYGRAKLLSKAKEKIEERQQKGGVLLVEGGAGVGKTAFMAALSHTLQTPDKMKKAPMCDVISYSTAASQSAAGVERLLRFLVQCLRKRKHQEAELLSDTPYRDLLSEFLSHLKEVKRGRALALLIDGADLLHDTKGQRVSEWIPRHVPKGVCLVLSVTAGSDLCDIISRTRSCSVFELRPLLLPERREIVQKELSVYGKKLSDSAFNNQLQTLLMKKGSANPLYLRLACQELRNYATFDKMKEILQRLPASLCDLIQDGLIRLHTQYTGTGLNWTLAALTVSSTGLMDRDLHFLLNLCSDLSSSHTPLKWQEVIKLARNPKTRVPMATFSQLARSLQSLIGSPLHAEPDQSLNLINPDVKSAFEQLYLSDAEDRSRAHLILSAHLWVRSDPHGCDTFQHCDPDSLARLPAHLMQSGQWDAARFLLSSYYFLYANVRHGLLRGLMETYLLYEETNEVEKKRGPEEADPDELAACHSFLKRHAPLLSHWPALFVQQALNEPEASAARAWAERALEEGGGIHPVRWMNSTTESQEEAGELVSTFQWTPSCVSLSPAGVLLVVGTEQGSLHLYHTRTNQEVRSLLSNCDGISGCVFLDECVLWSTSYDGQMEGWDLNSGCRTAHLTAHTNRITGCDVSRDRKHFATVSLDFTLKVWSSHKGIQEASLRNPSPLNCVTFDPEGSLVAVGGWDGAVQVWDWIKQEKRMSLSGHQCSVRSVSFSPSSSLSLLCSGALDGEMRFWSVPGSSCVWRSRAHRGSAEALRFLNDGESLLSAGHDGMVQLWSGGLGCSVSVLGEQKKLLKSSEWRNAVVSEDAALCVSVSRHYAAVGFHGNGLKLYNIHSGGCVWSTEDLRVSMLCVLWLQASSDALLLSGGSDHRLRLWRKRRDETLTLTGVFGVQKGAVLALSQNTTHVASASDDFTIALWLKKDLTFDPWAEPTAVSVLRGHSGGVTCLSFSPREDELLSGGKDKALMVWKISSSPPSLSRSFLHCHGDWITGCAWTPSALLSCSNDCRLRLWDVQTGSCIREVSTVSSVSALCCWEDYVMLGLSDGQLMVWKSDLGVITEIKAHSSRLHHTTIISKPGTKPDNLLMATASDDGCVKVWKPLQVEHRSTLLGHTGGVSSLASCSAQKFLSVSEDHSLRVWSVNADMPPRQLESVSVMCFLELQDVLVCGFSSGRLEIWKQLKLLHSNMLSDSCITAVSGLPDDQLAVGCSDASVSVWKLERDSQRCITGLCKVSCCSLSSSVMFLHYCGSLLGVCVNSTITHIPPPTTTQQPEADYWFNQVRLLGVQGNGDDGMWLLGEEDDVLKLAYLHVHYREEDENRGRRRKKQKSKERLRLDTTITLKSGVPHTQEEEHHHHHQEDMEEETEEEVKEEMEEEEKSWPYSITAAALHNKLVVCGDSSGGMCFNQSACLSSWTQRKVVHSDRISALCLTERLIISASYDKTLKVWDRTTKKQLGVFVCGAPVEVVQVNPTDSTQIVCGDALGQIYFLSWRG